MKKCLKFKNKKRYSTKKAAEVAIILSDRPFDLDIYFCEICKGWHLTSKIKN